ncbi:MAG: HAD family hydrolase [Methanomicrobiales archaeon]|nr:HAD family hydrolase [Methanomicrobiales archaeon]
MAVAVVFDSAGTLLRTFRVAKDLSKRALLLDIETTILTFSSMDRVLLVLHAHSKDLMNAPPRQLLSEYLKLNRIGFGIACTRKVITAEDVAEVLYHDGKALVEDLQECIRAVWEECKREAIIAMDSGAIVNMSLGSIEFVITTGGKPFSGAREAIRELHHMGIATYIASGDREAKLERIADYLGIPRENVFGIATPSVKAKVVEDLRERYDMVVMVGDGINDLPAFRSADTAILTEQQAAERPDELYRSADYVVQDLAEVVRVVRVICESGGDICRINNARRCV